MSHASSCPPRSRLLATTALLLLILGMAAMTVPVGPAHAACAATTTGLACDGPDDVTLASSIGGSGGLSKASTGSVTLSAANTYAGGTSLTAGTLSTTGPGRSVRPTQRWWSRADGSTSAARRKPSDWSGSPAAPLGTGRCAARFTTCNPAVSMPR
ncbi:hypothetical protein FV226_27470 [Methylobacterium sp. WL12]|nr:hypothetical protein FV226_27470 [Methylobacterium sp. WL12]